MNGGMSKWPGSNNLEDKAVLKLRVIGASKTAISVHIIPITMVYKILTYTYNIYQHPTAIVHHMSGNQ